MKIYTAYYKYTSFERNTQSYQAKKSEEYGNVFSSDFTFYTNSNSRAGIIPCLISNNFCRYHFSFSEKYDRNREITSPDSVPTNRRSDHLPFPDG